MPLAIGVGLVLPPPPVDTGPGYQSGQPPAGTMRATWIDPDGRVWELSGPHEVHGWLTRPEIAGWGAAPVTMVTDPLARGGVSVRHQRREPRRLTWPLNIYGNSHAEFLTRYRALMRAFTSTKYKGAGILRIARTGEGVEAAREIEALYEDGFAGEPRENWTFANPNLTLFCPDGFWRSTEREFVRRSYSTAGTPYLAPYRTVSSSQVLGDTTVNNPGDVEAWPSWTIRGPATQLVATNRTTGESFTLTHTLAAGQTATITITPTRAMLRDHNNNNLVGKLNWPGAVLWGLVPGVNEVDFEVNGSGPGTEIELSYYPRYETA